MLKEETKKKHELKKKKQVTCEILDPYLIKKLNFQPI